MNEPGKNYIAVKVFDNNCDICKHMSKHDRVTFEEFPEIGYQEVNLDDIINHNGNLTKLRIYQILEKYAVNRDYTIDLPVYVVLTKQGQYKGHHIGVATIVELRDKIKEMIEDSLLE